MKSLPRSRQGTRSAAADAHGRAAAQETLTRAFVTFTQAAGSLEKSYLQLQAEVSRLHAELQRTNSELDRSLEENARMRGYLSRVLENLPCGVLVVGPGGQTQIINPEARRLLEVPADWSPCAGDALPAEFEKVMRETPAAGNISELEWTVPGSPANRYIGILRANVSDGSDTAGDTIS